MIKTVSGSSADLNIIRSEIWNDDGGLADAVLHYSTGLLWLYENRIESNRGNSARVSGYGLLDAYNNDIKASSSYAGIYMAGGGSALLADAGGHPGYNEFDGAGYSLRAYGSGTYIAGGGSGHNAYDNHFCGSGLKVVAENSAYIWAREDYWPGGSPAGKTSGSVDTSGAHGEDSSCNFEARKRGFTEDVAGASSIGDEDDLARADRLLRSGDFAAARSLYGEVAAKDADLLRALVGMKGLMRVFVATRDESVFAEMADIARRRPALGPFGRQLQVHMLGTAGNLPRAQEVAAGLSREYPGSDYAFFGAMSLAHFYFAAGETEQAHAVLRGIQPSNDVQGEILAGVFPEASKGRLGRGDGAVPVADDETIDTEVYPNPFNPAATIAVRLEKVTDVRASIFDLIGREVAVIHSGPLPAGRHAWTWDASGRVSGTYFVVIRAGESIRSIPIVLMK